MPPVDTNSPNPMSNEEAANLKGDIDAIRKDIRQLFEDLKRLTKDQGDVAGRRASELRGAAFDAAREKRDDVEEYVKEHPIGALAAAAGVGFILALLVGR